MAETFLTLRTFVWFFKRVLTHMNGQVSCKKWNAFLLLEFVFTLVCTTPIWYVPLCEKDFPQTLHFTHFSPLWILLWTVRFPLCKNSLSHTWRDTKDFQFMCIAQAHAHKTNRNEWEILLLTSHLTAFSPVWIRLWMARLPGVEKFFPQSSHWTFSLSAECFFLWIEQLPGVLKTLLQISQRRLALTVADGMLRGCTFGNCICTWTGTGCVNCGK